MPNFLEDPCFWDGQSLAEATKTASAGVQPAPEVRRNRTDQPPKQTEQQPQMQGEVYRRPQ